MASATGRFLIGSLGDLTRGTLAFFLQLSTLKGSLLVLLSTFGGLALFGPVGFIVGPIVAALFVTVWHIHGEAARDRLSGVASGSVVS